MEIKKSILIIKSASRAMNAAENFLRNREWQIHSTTNIKEALDYMVKEKPPFVMVAVDHPVKKIRSLPKLLPQAFQTCVIAFSEQSTTQAYKLLVDSGCEYRINPPCTGPSIERIINKYVKDQELLALNPAAKMATSTENKNQNPGTFVMKGGSSLAPSSVNMQGERRPTSETELTAALLKQLEDVEEDADFGAVNLSGTQKNSPGHVTGHIGSAPEQKMGDLAIGTPGSLDHGARPAANGAGNNFSPSSLESQKSNSLQAKNSGPSASSLGSETSEGPSAGNSSATSEGAPGGPLASASGEAAKNSQGADPIREAVHQNVTRSGRAPNMGWDKHDSVIGRGAQKALDESADHKPGSREGRIRDSSHVACIVVESPRFSGYLVAAMGRNCQIDEAFIKLIKERLFTFLKAQGEQVQDEQDMGLKIREVDFEDWALEYADFLRKSVHGGNELALAFFPFVRASTKLGESLGSAEMGAVKMEDLQGDLEVEFNLYIYLPANNRYVLYTPKGGKFYGNQKDRLSGMGVTHLHMRKSETQDLSKYRAQNYLNSKIDQYTQKKGSGKAS